MINLKEQFYHWRFLRSWRPYFVIIVLGFLLYSQALFFDLTYLDDNTLLIDNQAIISDIRNLPLIFSDDVFFSNANFYYRPLLNVSFMIDNFFAGDNLFFFFFANILLHVTAACLVFCLLKKIINRKSLAFLLSLVFLVHPAVTQAVVWLPGRNDSLLAVLALLAFLFLIRFNERPILPPLILYTAFFWLALLTKETAVFIPFLAIIYFFTIGRHQEAGKSEKLLVILMSFLAGVVWYLLRHFAFTSESFGYLEAGQAIIKNFPALILFFGKMLLPFNLNVFPILENSSLIFGTMAIIFLSVVITLSKDKNKSRLLFGLIWMIVFLVPALLRMDGQPDFLEHRLYLPLIGFLIMISEIGWIKKLDFKKRQTKLIIVGALTVLVLINFGHARHFRDRIIFWEKAVQGSPLSVLAQKNLGAMYYLEGRLDEAMNHYLQARQLNPSEPMINNNIGLIYLDKGDEAEAEKFFLQELSFYPNYDKALFNLGALYYRQNKLSEARALFQATLRANPRYLEAYQYLQGMSSQLQENKSLE